MTHDDILNSCKTAEFRLSNLISLYKAMMRSLNREDIRNELLKRKMFEDLNWFQSLSGSFILLSDSRSSVKEMVFVHSWTLFETWLKDLVVSWLIVEPGKLIVSEKSKVFVAEVLKHDRIDDLREYVIRETLKEIGWNNCMGQLELIKECFGIDPFAEMVQPELSRKWFSDSRSLRNEIVHSQFQPKGILGLRIEDNERLGTLDIIVKTIVYQLRIVECLGNEVARNRDKLTS